MAGNAATLLSEFAGRKGAGAFVCARDRSVFAKGVRERVADPSRIDQLRSSLCGPASFLFCLATKSPDVYVRYALELFEQGKTKVRSLKVEPGSDCKNAALNSGDIDPVDWVTLASLRDSSNSLFDYQSVENEVAGITPPSTLAGWFRNCGAFKDVQNDTNIMFDKDVSTLVKADSVRSGGAYVCLLIGATVLSGKAGGDAFPDHWVVLNNSLRIAGNTTIALSARGGAVDYDQKLRKQSVSFDVYTWGDAHRPVSVGLRAQALTLDRLLKFFYGYVSAK